MIKRLATHALVWPVSLALMAFLVVSLKASVKRPTGQGDQHEPI